MRCPLSISTSHSLPSFSVSSAQLSTAGQEPIAHGLETAATSWTVNGTPVEAGAATGVGRRVARPPAQAPSSPASKHQIRILVPPSSVTMSQRNSRLSISGGPPLTTVAILSLATALPPFEISQSEANASAARCSADARRCSTGWPRVRQCRHRHPATGRAGRMVSRTARLGRSQPVYLAGGRALFVEAAAKRSIRPA